MRAVVTALMVTAAACSAPVLHNDLAAAEAAERAGNEDQALAAYVRAQTSCTQVKLPHQRRRACADAHLQRAELLEELGRTREAAEAYVAAPEALEYDPTWSAKALYRAGRLYLALGEEVRGYQLLWKAVTDYPDVAYAVDALRVVFNDGRRRNPRQLFDVLGELVEPLAGNDVADNVLFDLAVLAEEDFEQPAIARQYLDVIINDYRDGGLFDESCWHAARLSRAVGDPRGAVTRLQKLLATREVAVGAGSYFSVWLDDAQLELGRVLRDDLRDYPAAVRAFETVPAHYPVSILRDDALWELAVAWHAAGNVPRACATLTALERDWPDSKHELERAPALRRELACTAEVTP